MRMHLKSCLRTATLLAAGIGVSPLANASVWNVAGSGDFGVAGNWTGGVPNGSGAVADFSQVDIPTDASVTLNDPVTLGQLLFGDTGLGSAGSWELRTDNLATAVITLDNGASKPVVGVGQLTPTTFDDAFIAHSLAGTSGFRKTGVGIATLGQGTTNTITGGIDIEQGTLRLRAAVPAQAITIANGARLDTDQAIRFAQGINVASGATATIRAASATTDIGNLNAAGATLNLDIPATLSLRANDNWALNGSPAAINVSGGGQFVLRSNGGSYAANSMANTALHLDNSVTWARTSGGPGGNTYNIGSLSGTSSAILSGGGQGGGLIAFYSVGALNTNTEFAGTIDTTSAPTPNTTTDVGGLNLTKVGTGTLTLSGTLLYQPNGHAQTNRRGGVTTVAAGTLKLTNSAAIPGGIVHATVGDVLSTVNVLSGATLDVSGYTAGTYSTANLQQVVGGGTVAGNYSHDEGFLRPGNTIGGTGQNPNPVSTPVGGAINFANNFTWNGGTYTYDLTTNPASGNDLITVAGTTTLTSGTVTPNFLGDIPTTGTYTLLTSGSFSGSASNITIAWPGRGVDPVPFISGNNLQFNPPVTPSANLVWVGNNGSNWDVETTANWTGASPNTFFQLDDVTFNDSASSFTVNVVGTVQPGSITVNNSTNAYTISGTGVISGNTGLTKTGSGLLTITTANTFAGPTLITGGSVDIGNATGALGVGTLTLSDTSLTVANTATAALSNSGLVLAGTSNTITVNGTPVTPLTLPSYSGSGNLTITSTVFVDPVGGNTGGKNIDLPTNNTGFTGDLNLVGATDNDGSGTVFTTDTMVVRTNGPNSSLPESTVTLTNGASLRDRATSAQTITLGGLAGDSTATLYGYQGGSGATARTWRIGTNNEDTTFAGVVRDGAGGSSTTAPTHIVKAGTGELALTGANTYTGDTTIEAGTLSISQAFLSDLADVYIRSGGVFDLDFASTDTIDSLYLGNTPQAPGTYGSLASSATFKSAFFTGSGILNVTTLGAPIVTPGDFDNDGDVDGRDFLVWQRGGSPTPLSATDLATWQSNYGSGALSAVASATAVPEPTCLVFALLAGLLVGARGRG